MGSRPRPVTVRGLFAPPRARLLRSGAPPERFGRGKDQGNPRSWTAGRMVVAGGAARSVSPATAGGSRGCSGTSPSGKGRILTSA